MDNYNGFSYQPNMYYQSVQPTVVNTPAYMARNWQQQPAMPSYSQPSNIPNTNLIWIQGENSVKAQYVPNGGKMVFFDSEEPVIYIKSVDASGKPEVTVLDYTERSNGDKNVNAAYASAPPVEYATKDQLDTLNDQFSSLNERLSNLSAYVTEDQFRQLNDHLDNLSGQVKDIENRITNFSKPQQTNNQQRKGNK